MAIILPANTLSAGGYTVANSCRFNDGDSPHMTKSSSAGVNDKGTLSVWVKRGVLGTDQNIYNPYTSSNTLLHIYFASDNALKLYFYAGGSTIAHLATNRLFRDCSAWYHIVLAIDSDQGTEANRLKLYINGTQETSFSSSGYPSSGADMQINNSGTTEVIGRYQDGTQKYFDGYMAEFVWIDGTQYAASDFGEFDADSPTIWKPINVSGLTFGTNGYYLDFEDSANLGNDANGGTDLTEVNLAATDQATDTPTNNFATMNPLFIYSNNNTFSEGNCVVSGTASAWQLSRGTIGVSQGKWFWEVLFSGGTVTNYQAGIVDESTIGASGAAQDGTTFFHNGDSGAMYRHGTDFGGTLGWDYGTYGTMDGSSDILGVALNADDDQITLYKNGAAIVSDFDLDVPATLLFPLARQHGSSQVSKYNFGGCSGFTVSSGNADGNGYGNFEYAPPSGYYALCTKNLAEFG